MCLRDILFLVSFLVFFHLTQTQKSVDFLGGIQEKVDANEGGQAFLRCAFQNRNYEKHTPVWQRGGTTITKGDDVTIEGPDKEKKRFKVKAPEGEIDEYNLVIEPVEREDENYKYTCNIYDTEKNNIIITSGELTIAIKQLPGNKYPLFKPLEEKYRTGSEIEITCYTEKTKNTKNTLTLYKDGVSLKVDKSADDNYKLIKYMFTARAEDNSKSFRCHLQNTILEGGRNKSTGLINIEFKPIVSIFEPTEVIENKEAIFICRSYSNPVKVTYEWKFSPDLNHGDFKIEEESKRILRIKKPNRVNNGSKVTCKATNAVGMGESTVILHVQKQEDTSSPPQIQPTADEPGPPINEMTLAIIIAAAGGCSVLIILIIILPMYYRYLKNCLFQGNIDMSGTQIAQPDIYFEPKDSIRPPLPTPDHVEQWRISVGIQVSPESNEHSYTEVGGNSSKGSDIIYGGSINDAATATYRSKSVYV